MYTLNIILFKEIFYNPETNTGFITSQLKNQIFTRKKFEYPIAQQTEVSFATNHFDEELFDAAEDFQFLKEAVLPIQKSELIETLKRTVELRKKNSKSIADIKLIYPFYFIDIELVSIFFIEQLYQCISTFNFF